MGVEWASVQHADSFREWGKRFMSEGRKQGVEMTREQAEKLMDRFVKGPGLFAANNRLNIPRICRDIEARLYRLLVKIDQAEKVITALDSESVPPPATESAGAEQHDQTTQKS